MADIKSSTQVKNQQLKTMLMGVALLMGVIMGGLYIVDLKSGQNKVKDHVAPEPELSTNFATPDTQAKPDDQWRASAGKDVAKNGNDISHLEQQQADLAAKLDSLIKNKALDDPNATMPMGALPQPAATSGAFATSSPSGFMTPPTAAKNRQLAQKVATQVLPPPPAPPQGMSANGTPLGVPGDPNNPGSKGAQQQPTIQDIDLDDPDANKQTSTDPSKKGPIIRNVNSFVPAGSLATVVLLGGFDAPTGGQAANGALPVVMRVKSFFHLPNFYRANLKECFITGSAYGDLASERAYIRTSKMSCVMKNGNVLEVDIKGHVNGEDGSFGMRGKVVSKQGQLLMQAAFAGLFGGLGSSIAQQNAQVQASALGTVTTIDPNKVMQSGLATGASTSLSKISDFYLAQANAIFPVIEIAGERTGEVYLMEGADFGQALLEAEQTASNDNGGQQ